MLIYFDESYDNRHRYLLYGALFVPPASRLHRRIERVREETGFQGEIKYTKCRNARRLHVCERVVDAFCADAAFFRCAIVEQHRFDYTRFGRPDEALALKRARAYKKFAEMLLHPFVAELTDAVLLADDLKRCRGDEFLERLQERFNPPDGPRTFRHLEEVSSAQREYQCLQVCDLLLGCVLNNLVPSANQYKVRIREYLCGALDVPNFLLSTWSRIQLDDVRRDKPKFHVWYWKAKKKA